MKDADLDGVGRFLMDYPRMAIRPSLGVYLRVKGVFEFIAVHDEHGTVHDAFTLEIDIPERFPRELPAVREIAGRIPRKGDFHVNTDGTLCLGSPLRLLSKISSQPTLSCFAERCIIPYLFAISRKLSHGGDLVFGELEHFNKGMLADYAELFGVKTLTQTKSALKMLGMMKRRANKLPCPCGCKLRLGKCKFNHVILRFRNLAYRTWYRNELKRL